jgi:nitrogen-specific signal transduction histidine kinase
VACNPDKAVQPIAVKRDALKQVLLNLIKNSVEALGESGKITIATRSNVKVNGKNYLAIVISDNGPGLPKEIRENLFQPVKSTKGEKRGVGLVIVKNLINEMHGGISCKSQEGLGATFQILLPQVEQ